jgi:hypothetical protein
MQRFIYFKCKYTRILKIEEWYIDNICVSVYCLHIISLLVETSVPLVHETMDTVSEESLGFDLVVACPLYSHVHDENHYTIGKLQYVTYTAVRDIHCST